MEPLHSAPRGIIFDLDNTLIDSRLDFDALRRAMGLPAGQPILEALAGMEDEARVARCWQILLEHELEAAERAVPLDGVREFLGQVAERGLPRAVVTRNSRAMAQRMLAQLPVSFDPVLSRDDGPVKPDPWPVRHVCRLWNLPPADVVMIGDFRFDVEAGRGAGTRTLLLTHRRDWPWVEEVRPDYVAADFQDIARQLFGV